MICINAKCIMYELNYSYIDFATFTEFSWRCCWKLPEGMPVAFQCGHEILSSPHRSRPALASTQPAVQRVQGHFRGYQGAGAWGLSFIPSSAQVRND